MGSFLLYHPMGGVSGPRLGAFMGIECGVRPPPWRPDFLIRYGTARGVPLLPSHTTINRRKSLSSYGGRVEQLNLLHRGGIKVPPYHPNDHGGLINSEDNTIGRDLPQGRQPTQGRGITFYPWEKAGTMAQHDMFMTFIPKDRQFRVHVIGGRARVRELVPDDESRRAQPIWNASEGFTFRIPTSPIPPSVVPQAVGAVAALGLDFGAVDVILHGTTPYVLEVNTAPGLCDTTLEWYASHLGRLIGITSMPGWTALSQAL